MYFSDKLILLQPMRMESELIKIRSSIAPKFKKKVLFKGTFFGACGAALLLSSLYMPPEQLSRWGLPIFVIASFCMAYGLIPYRKLMQIDQNPNVLALGKDSLYFFSQQRVLFSTPLSHIRKMFFMEHQGKEGLAVELQQLPHISSSAIESLNDNTLFFPHFTRVPCISFIEDFHEIVHGQD